MENKETYIASMYIIFAKKGISHFKCIEKHKIIPRSFCLSAIMLISPHFFAYFNDFEFKLLLQQIREETQ